MRFGLGVFFSTVQTGHNLSRFPWIGCPACTTTELMAQRLGFEHLPARCTRFRWSILEVQTQPCSFQFGLIRTLPTAGHCSRNPKELSPTHDTVFRRILLVTPPIPPGNTAVLTAGLCLPICLEHGLADHTGLGRDRPILGLLLPVFVNLAAGLPTGKLMRPNWDEHQFADSTNLRCVPSLLTQLSSPPSFRPTPRIHRSARVLHLPQSPHTSPRYKTRGDGNFLQSCSACSSYINGCQCVDRS